MIGGHVLGGAIAVPFLYDLETHVRFLIALPVLICADLLVHNLIRPVANTFLERRIIIPDDIPKFHKAIDSTLRLRKSLTVEIALLVLVYTFGLWIWRSQVATAQQAGMRCQKRRICISHLPGIGMPSLVFLSSNSSCCVGTFGCFSGFSFFGVSQG
jgi:hypothetical protein